MSSFCPLTFELPRRRQRQPRLNGVVTAVLRPIALERFHYDLRRLGREHPFGANFGEVPYGGAFERQDASLVTEERGNRLALNFSDRFMIRQDGEDWHQGVSPQIRKVIHVGVYDSPGNASADRRFGDLGHGGADWFCQNCIGALRWVLDET